MATSPSWSSLASLRDWLVGPEVDADEEVAFAEHTRALTATLWPGLGLLLSMAALLWWPLDYVVVPESQHAREAFARFRLWIIVIDVSLALTLPRVELARRHAHVVAALAALLNILLAVWFVAEAGEGAPIWFYYTFMIPFLAVLLLVPLRTRVVIAVAFTTAIICTWLAHPLTRVDAPGASAGISFLVFCSALGVFLGHLLYVQVRRTYHLGRRVERQRLELAALAARLEERVHAQTDVIRELHARTQSVRAEQRLELARELHDGLGQELTSMRILVDLGGRLQRDSAGVDTFASLAEQLQRIQGSLRQVLLSLRPAPLEDSSLIESLTVLVGELGRRSGLVCRFTHDGVVDELPPEMTLALYRVAQEGLTNAIRHARARRLDVHLAGGETEVTLEVRDDGQGIDLRRVGGGFGTRGIQERASALGGRARRTVDHGTRLIVCLPRRRAT